MERFIIFIKVQTQSQNETLRPVFEIDSNHHDGNCYTTHDAFIIFTETLHSGRIWHKVNFLAEFNGFEFSKTSCLAKAEEPSLSYYFTHSWRENNWIHTFPKGISSIWNAISLVQDLNLCLCVHFLRR